MSEPCTEKCRASVLCVVCGKRKAPVGRDVGIAWDSYCMLDECAGYQQAPRPPHLWPSECVACWNLFMAGERRDCDECIAREAALP